MIYRLSRAIPTQSLCFGRFLNVHPSSPERLGLGRHLVLRKGSATDGPLRGIREYELCSLCSAKNCRVIHSVICNVEFGFVLFSIDAEWGGRTYLAVVVAIVPA